MDCVQVTLTVQGTTIFGEVIAVIGSCETFGSWCLQKAVPLEPAEKDVNIWKKTIAVPKGAEIKYRYFKGFFLESKMSTNQDWLGERVSAGGPCQVVVNKWETHQLPRSLRTSEADYKIDEFGFCDGIECTDSGWLTCQTEIRLRLHYSVKPPVSITKRKFKKSRLRLKLMLEGVEEEEDDQESPSSWPKMTTTLEISMISDRGYKSRHSQPDCGYALEPTQWTEYSIHTMDPDNLELLFEFFEEDLGENCVQSDTPSGPVGTACLLSSSFFESGNDTGVVTLPIMSRTSRQTIGKVRVDYLVIQPIKGFQCDMSQSFTKYWRKRIALNVGHRGAGSTHADKHHRIKENTIASFISAAGHAAAYVEFDVHLSKDLVPVVYHDLTCCISTKKKNDKDSVALIEVPVKDLTFDQLQLLKLDHITAMNENAYKELQDEEESIDEHQPFPSLSQIFHVVPDHVGFNIELKWIAQLKDGSWDANMSTYFNMNQFLDIILTCVLQNAGKRRIVFSSFDPDVCAMVRRKQNKYPVLFLTQGVSKNYPQLMNIRCQTTQIAISFAQSEDILGISANSEELLTNMDYITDAQSKGLVVFCWGEDNNDQENRRKLREKGIDGLIYDRISDDTIEQHNIFKVEEQVSLKEVIPEETLKNCACIPSSSVPSSSEARAGYGSSSGNGTS